MVPTLGFGGGERVAVNLANLLCQSMHKVTILCYDMQSRYNINNDVLIFSINEICNIQGIIKRFTSFVRKFIKIRKFLNSNKFDSIITIMPSMNVFGTLIVDVNLVITEHNIVTKENTNIIGRLTHYIIVKLLYKKASHIVCVSKGVKSSILKINKKLKPIVIYNPIDVEQIKYLSKKNDDRIPAGKFILGVGRLHRQKGFDLLIRAFAKSNLNDYELIIMGDGPEKHSLQKLAKKLNIEKKVVFESFKENPFNWMRNSKCFILSSRWEGFGLVLAEAVFSNSFCISFDCNFGPSEILLNTKLGKLVPSGCVDLLAKEMQSIPHVKRDKIKNDDLILYQKFSSNIIKNKYLNIL